MREEGGGGSGRTGDEGEGEGASAGEEIRKRWEERYLLGEGELGKLLEEGEGGGEEEGREGRLDLIDSTIALIDIAREKLDGGDQERDLAGLLERGREGGEGGGCGGGGELLL